MSLTALLQVRRRRLPPIYLFYGQRIHVSARTHVSSKETGHGSEGSYCTKCRLKSCKSRAVLVGSTSFRLSAYVRARGHGLRN